MKRIYVVLLFAALTCGSFFMPFEKSSNDKKEANAQLCGLDAGNVCCVTGSACYCMLAE